MIDWLTARAAVAAEDAAQLAQVRADLAYDFLLAGGQLSAESWAALDHGSRAALAAAGDRLRREFAALIAAAISVGPEQVLAPVDDGRALAERVLREGCTAAKQEAGRAGAVS